MTFLLDVNVLIALIDPLHIHHLQAEAWFLREGKADWATCPLTENGTLRIVGDKRYANSPGSPVIVAEVLSRLRDVGQHRFWSDDVSLLDPKLFTPEKFTSAQHITDTYLLALAVKHDGKLATFDKRLKPDAVKSGATALHVIAAEGL
ncbi:MAG TPA: TA system VapC family ribonuclease toxin [Bosea sp. (in: a-proteobacteria)]|nr:TA system VapC family ribonuclease toxin [Bosea sp. (in: a-proteobacteria)]